MTTSPYVTPIYSWRSPEEYDLNWYTEFASMMSSMENTVFAVSTEAASAFTTVSAGSATWASNAWAENLSAGWTSATTWAETASSLSACWVSACQWTRTASSVSARWVSAGDWAAQVSASLSGYWDDTHTTVSANSATWGSHKVATPNWDATEISYDSGWIMPPDDMANNVRIAHGLASEPDFAFLWGRGWANGDRMFTGNWGLGYGGEGVGIIEQNGTNITIHGRKPCLKWYNESNTFQCSANPAEFRVLCVTKTPDYEGSWTALPAKGTQTTEAHSMGSVPDFYTLELADSVTGGGDHGYAMAGHYESGAGVPCTIVDVDATNITFSVGASHVAHYYDYANTEQDVDAIAGWFYRVKAWDWTPDYTSDWTQFATTLTSFVLYHNLGEIPWLYLLEFSKASDGSDDIVPMMHPCMVAGDFDYGIHLYHLSDKYAAVRYDHGAHNATNYEDSGGSYQNLTTGYFRLKLWI